MATYVYRNYRTNQLVYPEGPMFAGNPLWELIDGPGEGEVGGVQAELDLHEAATTSVHGISNTANLETTAGAQAKADAAAGLSVPLTQKGAANGVASLGSDSKIPANQVPPITLTDFLGLSANQAAMLALTPGQLGDWTIRTDISTVWVISGADASQLSNWTQLSYPSAPVLTVAGKIGNVTLAGTDITSGTVPVARLPIGTDVSSVAAGNDPRFATGGAVQSVAGRQGTVVLSGADIASGTVAYARLPVGTLANQVAAGDVTTTALATKVGKGDLVFNVKDYGAVGNGSTDDLIAINACLTAANAAVASPVSFGSGPRVYFPPSNGYRTTDTVTVPDGIDLDMQAPIIYDGADGRTALVIGSSIRLNYRSHRGLWVKRATLSSWTDEADIGIVLLNHWGADIQVREVRNFTVGMRCIGDGFGFVYNRVSLGAFIDCKISLDLTNNNTGWCNENVWIGGEFSVSSSTYNSIDRIGIRITSINGAVVNNGNYFVKPSFEIKGGSPVIAAEGVCVYAPYGSNNTIVGARHESPDAIAIRTDNTSTSNRVEIAFNLPAVLPTYEDLGTRPGSIVRYGTAFIAQESVRPIYSGSDLNGRACYYDGATRVQVPGMVVASSSTSIDDSQAFSALVLNADYLEVPNSRMIGFFISTRTLKRFCLFGDFETGFGGRLRIRAYDAAGAIITTAGTVKSSRSDYTYATAYGGAHGTGSDNVNPRDFSVGSNVDHIFVGLSGGTAAMRLRSFQLCTPDATGSASAYLPFVDNGENWGTTPPTAGTWAVGRRLWNAAPAAAGTPGWICVTAGTPGTWKAMASLAA